MLVGTHALLPVCACLIAENLAARAGREPVLPPRALWVIGGFGVLPDICTPHLDLADRYASWSHTLFFMAGLLPVTAIKPDAVLDGVEIARLEGSLQVDNMEGIDARVGPGGETEIVIISDDNYSFLQRTLLLMFRLAE